MYLADSPNHIVIMSTIKQPDKTQETSKEQTNLNFGLQRQKGISIIAHSKNSAEPVLRQIPNLQNLELRGRLAEVKLLDEYVIDDDRRFLRFVQCSGQ